MSYHFALFNMLMAKRREEDEANTEIVLAVEKMNKYTGWELEYHSENRCYYVKYKNKYLASYDTSKWPSPSPALISNRLDGHTYCFNTKWAAKRAIRKYLKSKKPNKIKTIKL